MTHLRRQKSSLVSVYVQCSYSVPAVYMEGTLQEHYTYTAMLQCTCSILICIAWHSFPHYHNLTSGTAGTLQVHCRYTATTLWIHWRYTAFGSVHCLYTAEWRQCTCSLLSAYTAATLKLYCPYTPLRSGNFSTQHILHGACVTYTSECIHHPNTRAYEDTLYILHNIDFTYTSWRMCHAHVTHTLHILCRPYVAYIHWCTGIYHT